MSKRQYIPPKDYKIIVTTLETVKETYKKTLNLSWEARERFILEAMRILSEPNRSLDPLVEAINTVLSKYPKERCPYNSSLIAEVNKLLKGTPFYKQLPKETFNQLMMVYGWTGKICLDLLDKAREQIVYTRDIYIIDRLKYSMRRTFLDHPNINITDENPYYKRNVDEYLRSRKLTEEFWDKEYDTWISYFKEEPTEIYDKFVPKETTPV